MPSLHTDGFLLSYLPLQWSPKLRVTSDSFPGPEPLPVYGEHAGARLLSNPLPSPALWPFRKPSQLQSPLSRGPGIGTA